MSYEWDDTKRQSNISHHSVDFETVTGFDWDASRTVQDTRKNYGEDRFLSIAPVNNRLHVLVWTPRGSHIRVISLRKANSREEKEYERQKNQ